MLIQPLALFMDLFLDFITCCNPLNMFDQAMHSGGIDMQYRKKKLIKVALPPEAINAASARGEVHPPWPSLNAASVVFTPAGLRYLQIMSPLHAIVNNNFPGKV
jgi:hypothetical protein